MSTALDRWQAPGQHPALAYSPPPDPTGGRLVAWAESLQAAAQLGAALSATAFVPAHFRGKPEESAAAILCGDELGLSPIQALRSIYVVAGTPALYARAMVALILAHGHEVWTQEDTATRVTVSGRRKGSSQVETVTWTADRARKAGYTTNKKYATDPQAMLYARASGDVARRVAPDVLAGVAANVEELELAAETPTTVRRELPAQPRKTAKRAAPPQPEEPTLEDRPWPEQEEAHTGTEPQAEEPPPPPVEEGPAPGQEGPEPIRPGQLRMLHASYRAAGIHDKAERLAYASGVVERDLATSTDLTKEEASRVLDALTSATGEGQPPDDED